MAFRYLILFVCVVCMGCSPSVPPGPIVLGHLNPASGDEEMQGIALAVEQMNGDPKKHVLGRKIKVIHAELGSSPDEAQAQTVRLLTVDKVDALFGANRWSQAEKMGMAAQSPSTVAMSFNGYAGSPAIAALFPVGVAPVERGRALARYLKEALKGSKAVVLKETDSLIAGIVARSFVGQCGNCSEYTLKGTDSLDFIKDLEQMKPDCILLCGSARSVLAWRAKLPAIPLLFGGEEAEIALFQSEGDFAKPIIAAVSFHPMDEPAVTKEFVANFRGKYAKEPTLMSAVAFDAVHIWAEAARRGNSIAAEKLREQFTKAGATFEVVTGAFSYGPNQMPKRPIVIVEFSHKGSKQLLRYEP